MLHKTHLKKIFYFQIAFLISSPLCAQTFQVYFGDLHQHSIFSWDAQPGAKSPAEAFAYARHVAKLDFMAITDHTNGLSENNYQAVRSTAQLYDEPDSQFVAIAGQELGSLGSGRYGHMNIFEPLTRADNASDDDTRFNLLHAYQFLIDNQLTGQFNHPTNDGGNLNFNNLEYFPSADVSINSLEVINGRRSANYEQYYLLALANGWHLGAVGDQDNHASRYGDNVSSAGDIYLTGLLADSLTKPKILNAIKTHRTYAFETSPASDRIFLTEFKADGHWMGETFDNDDSRVDFTVAAHALVKFISAQLYKNGHLINRFEPDSNRFEWQVSDTASFGSVYYFLKLIQEDTDVLWSSPIWVNSPGQYQDMPPIPVSIAELRENFPNGLPRNLGWTNVALRGVATAGPQFGTNGPGYLQDETGGIAVFGSLFVGKVVPNFALEYEVIGAVSFFNGLTEFIPHAVTRSGVKTFPQPKQASTGEIAQNGEIYEGQLVTIVGVNIPANYPPAGNDGNIIINDGSGACTLRIDRDTNIPGTTAPNGVVNITGIAGQFDTESPYNSGYQILPRSTDDITLVTAIEPDASFELPKTFALHQNYPNPFNAGTVIAFSIPRQVLVSLEIYSVSGQKIMTLMEKKLAAGTHKLAWEGTDSNGQQVASGVYLLKLQAGSFRATRKLVLMR